MCDMTNGKWFRRQLKIVFGEGGQTAFARLLALAGDKRPHKTILRSINAYANDEHALPGEVRAMMRLLAKPEAIPDMLRLARREPEPPAFQLRELPEAKKTARK